MGRGDSRSEGVDRASGSRRHGVTRDCRPEPVAEPAREALAAYVTAQRTTHGPDAWAHPHPLPRRVRREAVMALARLGDVRAVPALLTALDDDVDAWRAEQVAVHTL